MNWIMFIILQLVTFGLFLYCFFKGNHKEIPKVTTIILWFVTLVFAGMLMMSSWNIERYDTIPANMTLAGTEVFYYDTVVKTDQWEAIGGVNIMLFSLSLIFGIYDVFVFAKNYRGK